MQTFFDFGLDYSNFDICIPTIIEVYVGNQLV